MIRRVRMKLSNETVDVLKNFSTINQNILVKEGTKLRTMSTMKNILGEAVISDAFPKEFGIYDLNEFLGVLTLTNDPELEFNHDSFLTVRGGYSKIKYFFSDPSILVTPPETFNAPDTDVEVTVTKSALSNVMKASAVMQLPDVVISGTNAHDVKMTVTDLKNTTSHEFTEELSQGDFIVGGEFKFNYKVENLKVIPGDYVVNVSTTALVSSWENSNKKIQYWIALEQPSD